MACWIRPWWLPARGGSRVVWEKTLLASQPAGVHLRWWTFKASAKSSGGVFKRQFHLTGASLNPWHPHVSQSCWFITSNYVESGSRDPQSSSIEPFPICFLALKRTLQLNRSCQTAEPCVCSADRAPALGSGEGERPLESGLLWKPDHSAAAD